MGKCINIFLYGPHIVIVLKAKKWRGSPGIAASVCNNQPSTSQHMLKTTVVSVYMYSVHYTKLFAYLWSATYSMPCSISTTCLVDCIKGHLVARGHVQ